MPETIALLVIFAIAAVLVWALFSLIGEMAQDRGHSPWLWWILSLVWSPFGTIVILWAFFPLEDEGA